MIVTEGAGGKVRCDNCGRECRRFAFEIDMARAYAADEGFTYIGGIDFCERCKSDSPLPVSAPAAAAGEQAIQPAISKIVNRHWPQTGGPEPFRAMTYELEQLFAASLRASVARLEQERDEALRKRDHMGNLVSRLEQEKGLLTIANKQVPGLSARVTALTETCRKEIMPLLLKIRDGVDNNGVEDDRPTYHAQIALDTLDVALMVAPAALSPVDREAAPETLKEWLPSKATGIWVHPDGFIEPSFQYHPGEVATAYNNARWYAVDSEEAVAAFGRRTNGLHVSSAAPLDGATEAEEAEPEPIGIPEKRCPFCGRCGEVRRSGENHCAVVCRCCGASGASAQSPKQAIGYWDTRYALASLAGEMEAPERWTADKWISVVESLPAKWDGRMVSKDVWTFDGKQVKRGCLCRSLDGRKFWSIEGVPVYRGILYWQSIAPVAAPPLPPPATPEPTEGEGKL